MEEKVIPKEMPGKCPECGSINLITDYDTGETVCGDCGRVVEQIIAEGPEWRAYTPEENTQRSRVGMPTTSIISDKGLSTMVGGPFGVGKDAFGRNLPLETKLQMGRLRKWQKRQGVYSQTERNLALAMEELYRLCDQLIIPPKSPVREIAAVIYRRALDKNLIKGRSIAAMVPASLFAACRKAGIPRTLQEIAEASLVEKKDVARCYRFLLKELSLQMPPLNPIDYVSKIAEKIGISQETQGLAIQILHQAKEKRATDGKDPMGLAAAALYIACLQNNEKKTQKRIVEVAGVTEVTLRNRYTKLIEKLKIELPPSNRQ
jgi:transcription initiation factor TFIIB